MAAADDAASADPLLTGGRWRDVLIGVTSGLAMFLAALDFSVNVALPELASGLDADLQSVQWALVVFMGVRASLVMGTGSFADRFGLRRVYLWGGMAYLVSMFCIALSPDLASVVGFRVLHGIGTSCMYAVAPAIAAKPFPRAPPRSEHGVYHWQPGPWHGWRHHRRRIAGGVRLAWL